MVNISTSIQWNYIFQSVTYCSLGSYSHGIRRFKVGLWSLFQTTLDTMPLSRIMETPSNHNTRALPHIRPGVNVWSINSKH